MDNFTRIIKDRTRREILIYLYNKGKATYSDILHDLKLSTGKLNYHLKILEPLILKEEEYYKLNEKGKQLVEIMLSLSNDKRETEYSRYLPQFLAIASLIFLFISGDFLAHEVNIYNEPVISNPRAFYTIYSISIIALLASSFLLYTQEAKGLENAMLFLSIIFPYAIYLNWHLVYLVLPAYLIVTSSVTFHYYIYELIPTLIYYFGILPKFINYNVRLMTILWGILIIFGALVNFSAAYLIDLSPLLLGLSIMTSRDSLKNYKILFMITLAIIVGGILFKMFIIY
ncbi:MAG: winged helix-turn-helix domain-containing protein [Saccharolobus sp.]|uniref:winged helix-turn-helix domain-containing protein n=1 Tax=Saccharolobus TaxID=2100760 RepID=UPI001F0F7B07|nr:winged helix-turn-helix domain-containing protein [Saccharolobus shibatae]MCH4816483.1 winged helix-turn-helix domain-containing protein [Saccharolobus shibatae]